MIIDGRIALPPVSLICHLGQNNGTGLTETKAKALKGEGRDVIETYRDKDLDKHQL